MNKKFELLKDDTIEVDDTVLHRIIALKNFGDVNKGDLGGYIEKEDNLNHDGKCWVYDNAYVFGDARVSDNARVFGKAWVSGDALVSNNARVFGNARVSDNARVFGKAWVSGDALVSNNARVFGNARVSDNARVSGDALVSNNARVYGDARVFGDANVVGSAWVFGNAEVYDTAQVFGDAGVFGNARVSNNAKVSDNARVFGKAWVSGDALVSNNAIVSGNARVFGKAWVSGDAHVSGKTILCADARVNDNNTFCTSYLCDGDLLPATFYINNDNNIRVHYSVYDETIEDFEKLIDVIYGYNYTKIEQAHRSIYYSKIKLLPIKSPDIKFETMDDFSTRDIKDRCERTSVTPISLMPDGTMINAIDHVTVEKLPRNDKASDISDALIRSMGLEINYIDTDTAAYNSNILHCINRYGHSLDGYRLTNSEFTKRYTEFNNNMTDEKCNKDKIKSEINKQYGIYGGFKKYEMLLDDIMDCGNRTLYRIIALKDFGDVNKGDLGGYIEKEDNLSHDGNCWVYDNAWVYGNARIDDNAQIHDSVHVFNNSKVCDNAIISGNTQIFDDAQIFGDVKIFDNVRIYGTAIIHGKAHIGGNDKIFASNWNEKYSQYSKSKPDKFITKVGNDVLTFYLDENNKIKVKSSGFNFDGHLVNFRFLINTEKNPVYGIFADDNFYNECFRRLFEYDGAIEKAIKFFNDRK